MLKPFVKWAGGKEKELKYITPELPKKINNYIEPFLGGGAVYFSINTADILGSYFVNDFSYELINLYNMIKLNDKSFIDSLNSLAKNWDLLKLITINNKDELLKLYKSFKENRDKQFLEDSIYQFVLQHAIEFNGMCKSDSNRLINSFMSQIKSSISRKIIRVCDLEDKSSDFGEDNVLENLETGLKSAYYSHIRKLYNKRNTEELNNYFDKGKEAAYFFFIREYCYASMFRYNSNGEFNVPYGGMAYNSKSIRNKIEYICNLELRDRLSITNICNKDFEDFLNELEINEDDFIFVDPPYDSEFSEYAQNEFNHNDQIRLADCLSKSKANVMVVIKETDFIKNIYLKRGFTITEFEKKYAVNFQNRNERNVKHLIIKNY